MKFRVLQKAFPERLEIEYYLKIVKKDVYLDEYSIVKNGNTIKLANPQRNNIVLIKENFQKNLL